MAHTFTQTASLQTAVLFLVFNRPDTTSQVFEEIRKAKPPRLYIACDGSRNNCEGEANKVDKVREIATAVDWPCEVKTLFRDENIGCKYAVTGGINWFFEHEEQGIILEDDCLPHPNFFTFCETLLERYKDDERVSLITGCNFQNGKQRGESSYYFSHYPHIWGWASWRRVWQNYDVNLTFWPEWKLSEDWNTKLPDNVERIFWENLFDKAYAQQVDTWDYQVVASIWFSGGLTATPNVNLISNIGFGPDSTHTTSKNSPFSRMPTHSLGEISHPTEVRQDVKADRFDFDWQFGKNLRWPRSILIMILRKPYRILKKIIKAI